MRAKQGILGLVYTGGEIRRTPLVGMQFLHEGAVRAGAGYEYYKRGTEPGTGKGRTVDTDTVEDTRPGGSRTDVGKSTGDTY